MKHKRPCMTQFTLEDRLTPAMYQVELVNSAIHSNTILCVSNETGLAFVPIILMKCIFELNSCHSLRKLVVYISPDGEGGLTTCKYNIERLQLHTTFSVCKVSADDAPPHCDAASANVFCMQASDCLRLLKGGKLRFSDLSLIVFDDCHVAVEPNSPYAHIVVLLKASGDFEQVRIFGMTSTIIGGLLEEPEKLEGRISQLETVLSCTAETMTDLSAMDTPPVKREEIIEIYDNSEVGGEGETTSDLLTRRIESTLQHSYHFLGDMVISQLDIIRAREEMVGKKGRSKADGCVTKPISRPGGLVEPPQHSAEWYSLQAFKEVPRKVFTEVETTLHELGPWCAACVALNLCSTLEKIIEKTTERLEKQLLQLAWTQLKYIYMMVQQTCENIMDYTELLLMATPKVRKLVDILKSYLPKVDFEITSAVSSHTREFSSAEDYSDFSDLSDGESTATANDIESFTIAKMKHSGGQKDNVVKVNQEETTLNGLVFVQRKHTAFALHKYIEELCIWDMDMYFIRSSYMIGSSECEEGKEDQMRGKKQDQRLLQFRQHKVNLLVGTSILESSVDLPKCNLIAMFDAPETYKSYIKSKSRAKSFNAKYYTICSSQEIGSFQRHMGNFSKIEKILQSKCQELTQRKLAVPEDTLTSDDLPPPFVAPKTGATVTIANAIGLLNRYCAKLPSDIFTRLTPVSSTRKVGANGYQATVTLPVNCRLKHSITGDVMKTEKLAIAAAALKTCEELYREGELDSHLAPIGKEFLRNSKQDADWEKEGANRYGNGKAIPGSSKSKHHYQKKVADKFSKPVKVGDTCYLYAAVLYLSIELDQVKHNKGREVFVTQEYPYTVGFITSQRLPTVAEFPVFTRSGQETVTVTPCCECRLTQAQHADAVNYHSFVFHNVLRIDKFPLKIGTDKSEFNVIVVPVVTDRKQIAWDYLRSTLAKNVDWTARSPLFSRTSKFTFREEDFRDTVVMPSYRNQDQPEFFYVAALRRDLTPLAPFPSPDLYDSFYSYYTSKYGLAITNSTQPLLDVDRTSARLNLMTPRYMNQKGMPLPVSTSHNKKHKKISTRERQILIPELCDIHPCTASMWRKLVCVPTILYRLNSLLLSHQLVCRINEGMNLECLSTTDVPSGDKLDLGIDFSLLQAPSVLANGTDNSKAAATIENSERQLSSASIAELEEKKHDAMKLSHEDEAVSEEAEGDGLWIDDDDVSDVISECGAVSTGDEEEEDGDLDTSAFELQLDKEEYSQGQGPSVTMILHALTMSNASDFINLERLETVGDSFLKFAVTLYLFCAHPGLHEGRLSYGRGKQVSNFNLYLLGKKLDLHEYLISDKFEPAENWLPPAYVIDELYQPMDDFVTDRPSGSKSVKQSQSQTSASKPPVQIPYNLRTQHSIPDKAIADCVESLIGCYLTSCGPYAARVFMAWLGINVLPARRPSQGDGEPAHREFDYSFTVPRPPSGLFSNRPDSHRQLNSLFAGLEHFEESIGYTFKDKAYLVQAFTHSSYIHNKVTDCYQRLEFLGDAVLDYIITRRLFEDKRKHSPGILTDLRSALVNNNVFAALAVKWNFHKHVKFISTQMYVSIHKFVQHQKSRNDKIQADQYLRLSSDGNGVEEEEEELEVPKVLGDIFESVAGAIYIDSNMSLDTIWAVYFPLMRQQIVQFSKHIPKSPVRELLEREPETAKFQKPERTQDGRARASVTVVGKGTWWGVGRSYRMAKTAAAKKALIALKAMESAENAGRV